MTELMTSLTGIFENIWLYGASFLLVLSLLVFVHEWGHYIVARMCGVRVEVFSIGFGKELFGRTYPAWWIREDVWGCRPCKRRSC